VKKKEYNILLCEKSVSLKTLPEKPNGIKSWLRGKECRTRICLPLINEKKKVE